MTLWEQAVVEAKAKKAAEDAERAARAATITEGAHKLCEYLRTSLGMAHVEMVPSLLRIKDLPIYKVTFKPLTHIRSYITIHVGSGLFDGHTYRRPTNTLADVGYVFSSDELRDGEVSPSSFSSLYRTIEGLLTNPQRQRSFDEDVARRLKGIAAELVAQGMI